ncbi:MAG: septation protein A [Gammaproteobacteria bacterium]
MKMLADFFPIVLFVIVYQMTKDFFLATGTIMVATTLLVAWTWYRHGRVERMPLIALALLLVFGGITLLLHDEVYLKWKVSIVNWLFGLVFLGSQFIGDKTLIERMMGSALELPMSVWARLNLAWAVFFVLMGFVNLYVAFNFDTETWVYFKLYGVLGLTLVFVVLQGFYMSRYLKPDLPSEEK